MTETIYIYFLPKETLDEMNNVVSWFLLWQNEQPNKNANLKSSQQGEDTLENECQGRVDLDWPKKRLMAPYFIPCLISYYSMAYKPTQPCLVLTYSSFRLQSFIEVTVSFTIRLYTWNQSTGFGSSCTELQMISLFISCEVA